ncbi:NUDIX domain-containing protein [Thalassotalea euphylliae]|uniref:NUDIX domain-containing protein n=1 Tax=Thalassotalea euphylliae TaxID=1655234 RepID=A0A3E0TV68_9GAMM|nr:NUDIX domain-containing protein [Thalassotalea euphylliae]REL28350.1 NUDIX domain-containing protein [Thalassotalea euphylliae]
MKKYVAGFLFTQDASKVVLIEKINPTWQRGLLNGVGGKIEAGEQPIAAMVREFAEETGVTTNATQWTHFAQVFRPNGYDVAFFFAHSDLAYKARTVEQEKVQLIDVQALPNNLLPNLRWLIPLALDQQADFTTPIQINEVAGER